MKIQFEYCTQPVGNSKKSLKFNERIISRVLDNTGCINIVTILLEKGFGKPPIIADENVSWFHQENPFADGKEWDTKEIYETLEELMVNHVELYL